MGERWGFTIWWLLFLGGLTLGSIAGSSVNAFATTRWTAFLLGALFGTLLVTAVQWFLYRRQRYAQG
jgi:hypothetical protein